MPETFFNIERLLSQAQRVQEECCELVQVQDQPPPRTVAGVDAAYFGDFIFGAAAVLSFPKLELAEVSSARCVDRFPYMPGLFAFREGPVLLSALERLKCLPDLLFVEGHGVAHPRGFGMASHIGILTGIATIGCAKTSLVGSASAPGSERGCFCFMQTNQRDIGAVVRTQCNVRPVFVSVGHKIDLQTSIKLTLAASPVYRLPEPLRLAHQSAERQAKSNLPLFP